jgi:hypothetical protein
MHRILKTLCVVPWLTGCGAFASSGAPSQWHAQSRAAVRYDFAWRLTGDRQVAPLQVFDDGTRTWLQFRAGQAVPAIFAGTEGGEIAVTYTQRNPYVVLDGKWPTLFMRGGSLQARADYLGAGAATLHAAAITPGVSAPLAPSFAASAGLAAIPAPAIQDASRAPHAAGRPAAAPRAVAAGPARIDTTSPSHARGNSAAASALATHAAYRALPADGNMRRVLLRWASAAGWTFGPEHWAVDVDIPLAGGAEFGGDFKGAVRGLMASTELGERPLQPCFYVNRVLRVVPAAQACDRSAARPGGGA